jgi:hypothetical protein
MVPPELVAFSIASSLWMWAAVTGALLESCNATPTPSPPSPDECLMGSTMRAAWSGATASSATVVHSWSPGLRLRSWTVAGVSPGLVTRRLVTASLSAVTLSTSSV